MPNPNYISSKFESHMAICITVFPIHIFKTGTIDIIIYYFMLLSAIISNCNS